MKKTGIILYLGIALSLTTFFGHSLYKEYRAHELWQAQNEALAELTEVTSFIEWGETYKRTLYFTDETGERISLDELMPQSVTVSQYDVGKDCDVYVTLRVGYDIIE